MKNRAAVLGAVTSTIIVSPDGRVAVEGTIRTQDQAHRQAREEESTTPSLLEIKVVEIGIVPFRVYPEQTSRVECAVVRFLDAVQVTL